MGKNYYDFVSFPNREEREKIRQDFFDFSVLRLCEDEIVSKDREVLTFKEFGKIHAMQSKIVFFNNNVSYIDLAGLQFAHYYNLFVAESDNECKTRYDILFKQAYRNMCMEIIVYKEKIVNLLYFVYGIKVDPNHLWIAKNELCQKIVETEYGQEFHKFYCQYKTNIDKIIKVRNNETHNDTTLLVLKDNQSETNNKKYFEMIYKALIDTVALKKEFQKFLGKIYLDMPQIYGFN